MNPVRYRLIDLVTGQVILENQSSWGLVQFHHPAEEKPLPGVKVRRGEYLALFADYGSGWTLIRDFPAGWVQLMTQEERRERGANFAAATALGHFSMVSTSALDAMTDPDAFRFLALVTRYHAETGTVTGVHTAKDAAEFLSVSPSNVTPTLNRLIGAGVLAWENGTLRVFGGVQKKSQKDTLYVFGYGIRQLMASASTTKHPYIGRLFKNTAAGAGGVVHLPTLDTKARRYIESLRIDGYPVIARGPQGYLVAPTLAFLGAPQQRTDALDSWAEDHDQRPA